MDLHGCTGHLFGAPRHAGGHRDASGELSREAFGTEETAGEPHVA